MKITRKTRQLSIAVMLMVVSPLAIAQVQTVEQVKAAEVIETVQQPQSAESLHPGLQQNVKKRPPASWHGKKVALRGRDVVSFTNDSGPVKGSKKYVAEWDDTKWYFANEKNRDAFKTDPKKYIPEFGGYCPVALSRGKAKVGRTNQFTRVDDKLYLNYNRRNQEAFATKPDDYIVKAQVSW